MQGDVRTGDTHETTINVDRQGEGQYVRIGPVKIDVRAYDNIAACIFRASKPLHALVVVEAFAASIEVEGHGYDLARSPHSPPLKVHLAVFQLSRLKHNASAVNA